MYLLVAMDYSIKWGEAYPVKNKGAATVANMLTNIIVQETKRIQNEQ